MFQLLYTYICGDLDICKCLKQKCIWWVDYIDQQTRQLKNQRRKIWSLCSRDNPYLLRCWGVRLHRLDQFTTEGWSWCAVLSANCFWWKGTLRKAQGWNNSVVIHLLLSYRITNFGVIYHVDWATVGLF